MADPLPADCLHCGVCCFAKSNTYVRVSGDDWSRLGAEGQRLAHFIGQRAYMKMEDGHCAALAVSLTPDGRPRHFCGIYERRPQVCRDLGRGSMECHGELAMKADKVRDWLRATFGRALAR